MSLQVAVALSQDPDPRKAGSEVATEALRTVPQPNLAILYASHSLDQSAILEGVHAHIRPEILVGGSSYAEMTSAGVVKGSVVLMLIALEGSRVTTATATDRDDQLELGRELGERLKGFRSTVTGEEYLLGLCTRSTGNGMADRMLQGIDEVLGVLPVFGGMSCGAYDLGMSHPDFWKSTQYVDGRAVDEHARLAAWAIPREGYRPAFGFAHGWDTIGPEVTFTRCEGDWVYEVDGQPVFEFYRQFLGRDLSREDFEKNIQRFGFAVRFDYEGGTRNLVKSPVVCDFEGERIRFVPSEDLQDRRARLTIANRQGCIQGARQAARECRRALGDLDPAFVLVVSCCTRVHILHSLLDKELEVIQEELGADVPIMGFYSGGELVPFLSDWDEVNSPSCDLHGSHFHATTVGILALGARQPPTRISVPDPKCTLMEPQQRLEHLSRLLEQSERIRDDTETFLTRMSRKSYRDGEELQEQYALLAQKNAHNEKLQSVIHRYTPHDIWDELGHRVARGEFELPENEVHATFFFMDVKGFTSYSEDHTSQEVVRALNEIFAPATEIIYECSGDIDKYIGDCIFAAFPCATSSTRAARRILTLFTELEARSNPFSVRIGINAGRAVRANVGGSHRREYTYIGDAVNLAQRLESSCTPGHLLVSQAVYEALDGEFSSVERREITVKGKKAPVVAFECRP